MKVYYNEWEPYCAQWLRNLIDAGHLPPGDVDERSITDVEPEELKGYTQHHFFAGIGGWALAARLAGVSESERIVTGSPPCQPFSTAGQGGGYSDERHLAPHWLRLVAAIRPTWVFGEQVAAAIRKDDWLDDLLDALEAEGYATGATVLPACSVGAPHIRQRLWVTARLADSYSFRQQGQRKVGRPGNTKEEAARKISGTFDDGRSGRMVNASASRPRHQSGKARDEARRGLDWQQSRLRQRDGSVSPDWIDSTSSGQLDRVADSKRRGRQSRDKPKRTAEEAREVCGNKSANTPQTGWNDADWLWCRDGKWRPVESGTFPLAHGISGRVGRLRAYGNAIVPEVAAEVIKEAMNYDY